MKLIQISSRIEGDFEGKKAQAQDFDTLVGEDAQVLKPDGSLLCMLIKRAHDPARVAKAWPILEKMEIQTNNRGTAAGEGTKLKLRKDGTVSKITVGEFVDSGMVGFFERSSRWPYCRACAWNLNHPGLWGHLVPLVVEADQKFKEFAAERYQAQAAIASLSSKDFLIPGTNFSTITVNRNFRTAYHRDAGNLPEGLSCMSVIRKGRWSGANLVFPNYGIAVSLDSLDLIIFDPHELHGNTPLVKVTKDAIRCSIVYYFREKIQHCLSAKQELARAQNRNQGEKLFETFRRPAK